MNKTRRVSKTIWGIILVCAAIGAFLLFGCNSLPAVSSLFATITPTATTTFTPTTTPTITPTRTPRPTPTATPDRRILNLANQHLYLYVKEGRNWHSAKQYCSARGSHLVTVQDEAENQYIYQLTRGATWLGATDEVKEGTWVWVSGEPWKYTTWRDGEPNNYQIEHYLTYHPDKPSSWNDVGNGSMYFVCEWESDSP